ncbi:MAG: hypothetical protein IPL52_03485 [Flavobacteriales bacterium]|nr:hypothetical protein [Flavobacteriales bacterium]
MLLAIILSCAFIFAPLTAFLAGNRGYDVMPWYLAGLALGPVGLLAGLLPRRKHAPEMLFTPELQSLQIG